ncbi:MAG: nuclear transport factor 2 family protein [Thiomicrospira sp.]|uniref:nuclear transport factor 2 family protein n=1 Tax=Thiomicrospira sp. TaxID=935 RepID=UPI0019ED2BD6|nr:nuclear transport factor 2 family protein [Thiomicrospira sp.]MBE0493322.1 nuclear transport factor 2 family protein [Thiomicrospira sp.]
MNIQHQLDIYKNLFENLTPETIDQEFVQVFDQKIYFKDPFNEVRGLVSLKQIFKHMFETLHEPSFRIHHMAGADKTGYLEWRFYFKLKPNADVQQINGMSKILFNEAGQVIVHMDYWDTGEYVYRKIPVLGWFIKLVANRLKAR